MLLKQIAGKSRRDHLIAIERDVERKVDSHQARFAHPRFIDDQRHLAFLILRVLPTIHQEAQFVLAPDEWSQSTGCGRPFQSTAHSARLDYPVQLQGPFNTLERRRPATFDHEQSRDQAMGLLSYQYRAGSG